MQLKKQIVAKTNVKFKEIGELDAALSEKNNFAIMELDDETILFMVGFDSYAQKTIKKWGDLDVESSDLYDYLIDLVDLFSWTLNLFDYE